MLVILNELSFEASKFETRTMPTPDMKGKEIIYWIKVETTDKRLVTDLERFLSGSAQFIQLKVPSAFISVPCEIEDHLPNRIQGRSSSNTEKRTQSSIQQEQDRKEERYSMEILLRRQLNEPKTGQTQSPYG